VSCQRCPWYDLPDYDPPAVGGLVLGSAVCPPPDYRLPEIRDEEVALRKRVHQLGAQVQREMVGQAAAFVGGVLFVLVTLLVACLVRG